MVIITYRGICYLPDRSAYCRPGGSTRLDACTATNSERQLSSKPLHASQTKKEKSWQGSTAAAHCIRVGRAPKCGPGCILDHVRLFTCLPFGSSLLQDSMRPLGWDRFVSLISLTACCCPERWYGPRTCQLRRKRYVRRSAFVAGHSQQSRGPRHLHQVQGRCQPTSWVAQYRRSLVSRLVSFADTDWTAITLTGLPLANSSHWMQAHAVSGQRSSPAASQ